MSSPGVDPARLRLADEPHHDGSPLYTDPDPRTLGSTMVVRLRVPDACGTTRVRLRSTPDAEPAIVEATIDRRDSGATWWRAELVLHNPITSYRWMLDGGALGRCWVNGAGVFHRDVTDDADFRLASWSPVPRARGTTRSPGATTPRRSTAPPPAWLADTVGYQIFIDRFANSGTPRPTPEWAIPRAWDEPVADTPGIRARHWYGGDLPGIEEHLDHLSHLGVNLIYLTPFFPAGSMHRYDASTFDHVDPALGGDEALAVLVSAAHDRGIRVIGDITLNHTGIHHDWFTAASTDSAAIERGFYFFDETEPHGYVAWHGVRTLPKLDHRSEALRERFYDGNDSVIAHYLHEPFGLDGWRVDCANTTARFRDHDDNHDVARLTRSTMSADEWLVAEHCYDARDDLDGTGWHGVMAYQWFTRPLWAWLKDPGPMSLMSAVELIDVDGYGLVESMRHLSANVSWEARQASMTMLDSHDTARFRTVVGGDRTRHLVGLTALFTMPGVPIGELADLDEGALGGDGRFLADVRSLIELRRTNAALQSGSMRWIDATADSVTFARETAREVVVVHLVRAAMSERSLDADEIGVTLDRDHDWSAARRFGAPFEIQFPRTLILPGTPGVSVVSFPQQVAPDLSGADAR